jgi:hypothetical protein
VASQRNVRPPLAPSGFATCGADDAWCGDDKAQVLASQRDELLDQHPLAMKPGTIAKDRETAFDVSAAAAQHHVVPPSCQTVA